MLLAGLPETDANDETLDRLFSEVRTAEGYSGTREWHNQLAEAAASVVDEVPSDIARHAGELAAAKLSKASDEYGVPADIEAARLAVLESLEQVGHRPDAGIAAQALRVSAVGYQSVSAVAA